MQKEVEDALKAVLHKDNRVQPIKIKTAHFLINCEMKPWAAVKKLGFEENGQEIPAYPDMIVLTVQPKPGRRSSAAYEPVNSTMREKENPGKQGNVSHKQKASPKANNMSNSLEVPSKPKISNTSISSTPKENIHGRKSVSKAVATGSCIDPGDTAKNCNVSPSNKANKRRTVGKSVSTGSQSASQSSDNSQKDSPALITSLISEIEVEDTRKTERKAKDALKKENDKRATREDVRDARMTRSSRSRNSTGGNSQPASANIKTRNARTRVMNAETTRTTRMQSRKVDHQSKPGSKISQSESKGQNIRKTRSKNDLEKDTCSNSSEADSKKSEGKQQRKQKTSKSRSRPSSQSASPISKRHTRLKSKRTDQVMKAANSNTPGSHRSQPSNTSSSPRRSKRLKTRTLVDVPPSKRIRVDGRGQNTNNNNSKKRRLNSVGTQTQISTYRIKNVDGKYPKKAAINSTSGRRPQRVLRSYPSTNEEMSTRSTNREALCYKRDRTLIQQEELEEEMKLQQMAVAECQTRSDKRLAEKRSNKRRSLISRLGDMITPVKKLFK